MSNETFSFKWYSKYDDKVLPCLSNLNELLTPPPKAFSITKLSAIKFGNSYLVTLVAPRCLKISKTLLSVALTLMFSQPFLLYVISETFGQQNLVDLFCG